MNFPKELIGPAIQAGSSLIGGIGGSMIDSDQAKKDRELQAMMQRNSLLQSGAQDLARRRDASIERNRGRLFRDQVMQVLGIGGQA